MGVTVSSNNICLAPSDSAQETADQVRAYTAVGQPAEMRTLWTGATYKNVQVPFGADYENYKYVSADNNVIRIADEHTIENMRAAVRTLYDQLNNWSEALAKEGKFHPFNEVSMGHNFLYQAYRGSYMVVARRVTAVSSLTFEQRIKFCQEMAKGAADVTDPASFFANLPSNPPTGPTVWVDPRGTPARVNLNQAANLSGSSGLGISNSSVDISNINFSSADWADDVTS